jgi:SAM-dependent methyltransferase
MKRKLYRGWLLARTGLRLLTGKRWDLLWYGLRTRMQGFDFGSVELGELGLDPDRSNPHANSGGPDLARVLRSLEIPSGSRIVDFGSGKGGAALTMSEFQFSEIVGLELSPALVSIAEANCQRARAAHMRFVQMDAAAFTNLDEFTHFYMYHPFPCSIVEAVCANLSASLVRRERRLTLIYKNPVCDAEVLKSGVLRFERDLKFDPAAPDWQRFRIYVHEKQTG